MIYFNFNLSNPIHTKCNSNITNYIVKNYKVTKNKNLEFQLCKTGTLCNLFGVELDTRVTGRDHAGINFEINICGYVLLLNIIDKRHWNFEDGEWY